jgi:hypothetical protein
MARKRGIPSPADVQDPLNGKMHIILAQDRKVDRNMQIATKKK